MKCSLCGCIESKVIDSRLSEDENASEDVVSALIAEKDLLHMKLLKQLQ